jgi:general secretion pathway protein J
MKPRGFTLIEVVIALAIVGALLGVMFGGLRLGVAAWRQGDARAEALQHTRSLSQLLTRALAGVHPYRLAAGGTDATRVVFQGEADRIAFVTATPPVPFARPIAFAAVAFSRDETGLVVLQKPLPDREPFERLAPAVADPTVTGLRLRYLRPGAGWEARWDGTQEQTLPAAVELRLATTATDHREEPAPVIIAIRVLTP